MSRTSDIPAYGLYGDPVPNVDAVHCERISDRARQHGWEIFPHRHDRIMQAIVLDQGRAEASADGKSFLLEKGSYMFVPSLSVHSFSFSSGSDGLVLSCPTDVMNAFGPSQVPLSKHLQRPFSGSQPAGLFVPLRDLMNSGAPAEFQQQALVGIGLFVLARLAEETYPLAGLQPSIKRKSVLDRFDAQIAADFADTAAPNRSPSEHARDLGVTTGHLSRICRADSGCGASAYLEKQRMNEARRLLDYTELNIAQISYRLGYPDPSYFTRRFRRACALTPTEFRTKRR